MYSIASALKWWLRPQSAFARGKGSCPRRINQAHCNLHFMQSPHQGSLVTSWGFAHDKGANLSFPIALSSSLRPDLSILRVYNFALHLQGVFGYIYGYEGVYFFIHGYPHLVKMSSQRYNPGSFNCLRLVR